VDAITGDGLCLGFRQAALLAETLAINNLSVYDRGHRRTVRLPAIMSRLMLAMNSRAAIRQRVLRALAAQPRAFSKLLAIHVGAISPAAFAVDGMLTLGWQFLLA
jgi:hypothetical protein